MTQEEKELLLTDLTARLRYRVCAKQYYSASEDDFIIEGIIGEQIYAAYNSKISMTYPVEMIKPYLRPMSSMTEDEKDYIKNVARFKQSDGIHYDDGVHYVPIYQETLDDQWKADGKFPPILDDIYRFMLEYGYILLIDFFNSHHLDYRGLIPRGLALEAPEDMYNIKKK